MAGRILNRRELRKQTDQAELTEQAQPAVADGETAAPAKKTKAKAAAKPKVAKPKVARPRKKKEPARLCVKWGVFDGGMKQVALFDYNQKAAAEQKVADLVAKKNAVHFLQVVKEPMPEPVAVEAPPA